VLISLIGLPGGGKSTVGRQLARRLRVDFADSDAVIEQRLSMSVKQIFERHGEHFFREVEQSVVSELAGRRSGVIATGGGVVLAKANRDILHQESVVVYLRAAPRELMRRLRSDSKRPLLQVADPFERIRELHSQRDPLYRETAHFVVETGRPSITTLVNIILMQLELAGSVDADRVPSPVDR
jgi:shikimate kinase